MPSTTPNSSRFSPSSGLRRGAVFGLAALLLLLFAGLCLHNARSKAAGWDEPGLILSGYASLKTDCRELPTRNLRFSEMWMAAPLLAFDLRVPGELKTTADTAATPPGRPTPAWSRTSTRRSWAITFFSTEATPRKRSS